MITAPPVQAGCCSAFVGATGLVDWGVLIELYVNMTANVADVIDLGAPSGTKLLLNSQAELLDGRDILVARRQAEDRGSGKKDGCGGIGAGGIRKWRGTRERSYQIRCSGDGDGTRKRLL